MGSYSFHPVCILHSVAAITCGLLLMFYTNEVFEFTHGREIAINLMGSTPHDQLLIQTSDSFSGLLLFALGFLLFMVAFVQDRNIQGFFARECVLLHAVTAVWRIYFYIVVFLLKACGWGSCLGSVMAVLSCLYMER